MWGVKCWWYVRSLVEQEVSRLRAVLTIVIAAAGIYFLLAALLYLFQNYMVFLANMPGRALAAMLRDAGWDYEDVAIRTSDGIRLHGGSVPADRALGTLL